MRTFDDLVREGKILYAGVSDMPAWVVAQANTLADLRNWTPFVELQVEHSLIERTPARERLPMAAGLGLGVMAWSPLARGALNGKQLEAGLHHCAVKPPSTSRLWAVTNDALLDESQMAASAISSDLPMRPMGCMAVTCARNSGFSPAKR